MNSGIYRIVCMVLPVTPQAGLCRSGLTRRRRCSPTRLCGSARRGSTRCGLRAPAGLCAGGGLCAVGRWRERLLREHCAGDGERAEQGERGETGAFHVPSWIRARPTEPIARCSPRRARFYHRFWLARNGRNASVRAAPWKFPSPRLRGIPGRPISTENTDSWSICCRLGGLR